MAVAALEKDAQSSAAAQLSTRIQGELAQLQETVEEASDPSVRTAAEQHRRAVKARFAEHNAAAADLQARQSEARQTLDAERARYEEIEAAFNRLERELDNAGGR